VLQKGVEGVKPIFFILPALCLGLGVWLGTSNMEPETLTVTEYETVEVIREVPIIQTVTRVETETEIVERAVTLSDFKNTDDLEHWLEDNHIDHAIMLYTSGKKFDCDDYARRLVNDARKDGYEMWVQVVFHPYRIPGSGRLITEKGSGHALCGVVIGNEWYFVEPQSDEYWPVAQVD